ncbi:hypothetical protein PASE110613_10405 [Paenibacillus sediminis]|uniref:Uncharacterized protein n=1 Tax=Paenibacillus sediminis TaxID=664909 RepID=A0ABS4H4A9_9BACL|nr:hypothetical protein [Paenibacillus sediminis]MBP1937369.1 hypothetical protein [Paenibacillus sediminis]
MNPYIHGWTSIQLKAHLTVHKVRSEYVVSGHRPVLLLGLSPSTLQFVSDLNLPVTPDVLYCFEIEDHRNTICITASVESKVSYDNAVYYRADIHYSDNQRMKVTSFLNSMIVRPDNTLKQLRYDSEYFHWALDHNLISKLIDIKI